MRNLYPVRRYWIFVKGAKPENPEKNPRNKAGTNNSTGLTKHTYFSTKYLQSSLLSYVNLSLIVFDAMLESAWRNFTSKAKNHGTRSNSFPGSLIFRGNERPWQRGWDKAHSRQQANQQRRENCTWHCESYWLSMARFTKPGDKNINTFFAFLIWFSPHRAGPWEVISSDTIRSMMTL